MNKEMETEEPNRYSELKNKWTQKFTRGIQQQIWPYRRKNQEQKYTNGTTSNFKISVYQKTQSTEWKGNLWNGGKHLQILYLVRG